MKSLKSNILHFCNLSPFLTCVRSPPGASGGKEKKTDRACTQITKLCPRIHQLCSNCCANVHDCTRVRAHESLGTVYLFIYFLNHWHLGGSILMYSDSTQRFDGRLSVKKPSEKKTAQTVCSSQTWQLSVSTALDWNRLISSNRNKNTKQDKHKWFIAVHKMIKLWRIKSYLDKKNWK